MAFVKKMFAGPKVSAPAPAPTPPPPAPVKADEGPQEAAEAARRRARMASGRGSTILTGSLLDDGSKGGKKASLLLGG